MNRPASMRLALGVGAWMVVILALTGCGGGSAREKAKARPLPEQELRELRPGEYRTEEFEPSASFTVAKGWSNTETQLPDCIEVGEVEQQEETAWINFVNVEEVFKPGTRNEVEAPEDLVGWFQHHPYPKRVDKGMRFVPGDGNMG